MATQFEVPRDPGAESYRFPEQKDPHKELYLNYLNELKGFLVEKHIGDPIEKPGYIYELPPEKVRTGTPDYTKYMCRGNAAQDIVNKIYLMTLPKDNPFIPEQVAELNIYKNELVKIFMQKDPQGHKIWRTEAEMKITKHLIEMIVGITEDALEISDNERTVPKTPRSNAAVA